MKYFVYVALVCMLHATGLLGNAIQVPGSIINNMFDHIVRLEKEMHSTKRELVAVDSKLADRTTALEVSNRERDLTQTKLEVRSTGKHVSFQVRDGRSHFTLGNREVLRFNDVTLNRGNAYNPKSGIFLTPVTGTYLFWANIMNNHKNAFAITLQREGQVLARGYPSYQTTLGVATIIHMTALKKGQHVWFANEVHEGTDIYGSGYSSYGGTLMYV